MIGQGPGQGKVGSILHQHILICSEKIGAEQRLVLYSEGRAKQLGQKTDHIAVHPLAYDHPRNGATYGVAHFRSPIIGAVGTLAT